jgi:hypothetical protein
VDDAGAIRRRGASRAVLALVKRENPALVLVDISITA